MMDGQNFFDQPVKNNLRTYDNIQKIATGQGDDYTTVCLFDYNYFYNYYKMIAIDLSKQQALDVDPKTIEQINFTGNLTREGILKKQRNHFRFFTGESFILSLRKYCNFFNIVILF